MDLLLGVGGGRVFKNDKTVYSLFIESKFSVAGKGSGQPQQQIFFGLNMQFLN